MSEPKSFTIGEGHIERLRVLIELAYSHDGNTKNRALDEIWHLLTSKKERTKWSTLRPHVMRVESSTITSPTERVIQLGPSSLEKPRSKVRRVASSLAKMLSL